MDYRPSESVAVSVDVSVLMFTLDVTHYIRSAGILTAIAKGIVFVPVILLTTNE